MVLVRFYFFLTYATSTIFDLLHDDITSSFAVSLHRTGFRICPSPMSVHRFVWLPVRPCERLDKPAADCLTASPPLLSRQSHLSKHASAAAKR